VLVHPDDAAVHEVQRPIDLAGGIELSLQRGQDDPSARQSADAQRAERQPRRLKLTPTGQCRPAGS
jgi:hypothetical protein